MSLLVRLALTLALLWVTVVRTPSPAETSKT